MIARCLLLALVSAVSGLVITPPLRLAPATTATPRCGLSLQQPPRMAASPAAAIITCGHLPARCRGRYVATALLRVVGASIFSSARAVENIADRIDPSTSTLRFVDRAAMAAMRAADSAGGRAPAVARTRRQGDGPRRSQECARCPAAENHVEAYEHRGFGWRDAACAGAA